MKKSEWDAAVAATASAAGICFASGRAAAMFFSQTGSASWIGISVAASIFSLLCGCICSMAKETDAWNVTSLCIRKLGVGFGAAVGVVRIALMVRIALAMLNAAGWLAALALPIINAYSIGMFIAMIAALVLCAGHRGCLTGFGRLTLLICGVFYIGNALDVRTVRFHRSFETVAELYGSVPASIVLGLLMGSLCALVSAGAAVRYAEDVGNPIRYAARCGMILAMVLSAANAAILRGGDRLLSTGMPAVVLAARWGRFGYYAGITVMFLCAVSTLTSIIDVMPRKVNHDKKPC